MKDDIISGPQLTESRRQSEIVNEGVIEQRDWTFLHIYRGVWVELMHNNISDINCVHAYLNLSTFLTCPDQLHADFTGLFACTSTPNKTIHLLPIAGN